MKNLEGSWYVLETELTDGVNNVSTEIMIDFEAVIGAVPRFVEEGMVGTNLLLAGGGMVALTTDYKIFATGFISWLKNEDRNEDDVWNW